MANLEHSTLTTTNLHENKGVSSATDNTVATAVSGATVWAKLTASNLTGTGNAFGAQLFHVQDQKASGTNGGSFTSGAWRTRTLQTSLTNEISSATLVSNQISLPAGTYYCFATGSSLSTGVTQLRIQNITDGTTLILGLNINNNNSTAVGALSTCGGRFTLAGTKVLELQHRGQNTESANGFGAAGGWGTEVYAEVMLWKIA